jgi:hypothetical protein
MWCMNLFMSDTTKRRSWPGLHLTQNSLGPVVVGSRLTARVADTDAATPPEDSRALRCSRLRSCSLRAISSAGASRNARSSSKRRSRILSCSLVSTSSTSPRAFFTSPSLSSSDSAASSMNVLARLFFRLGPPFLSLWCSASSSSSSESYSSGSSASDSGSGCRPRSSSSSGFILARGRQVQVLGGLQEFLCVASASETNRGKTQRAHALPASRTDNPPASCRPWSKSARPAPCL